MRVKITKLAEIEGGLPAATPEEYPYGGGGMPDKSIPVDYWLTGDMPSPPKVGESLIVFRDSRNGVKCPGVFSTSPVTQVTEDGFTTRNSVYLLTKLNESVS